MTPTVQQKEAALVEFKAYVLKFIAENAVLDSSLVILFKKNNDPENHMLAHGHQHAEKQMLHDAVHEITTNELESDR